MSPALNRVLMAGATYLCLFAPNATALHLEADTIIVNAKNRRGRNHDEQRGVVCTVGEDGDSLREAAWFVMNCANPPRKKPYDFLLATWGSADFKKRVIKSILTAAPKLARSTRG